MYVKFISMYLYRMTQYVDFVLSPMIRVGQWREETEGHSGDSNLSRLKERFPGQGKPCVQVKIFQLFIIQVPGSGSSQGLKNQGVISYRKQYRKKTLSKLKENIIPLYHRKLSVFFDE